MFPGKCTLSRNTQSNKGFILYDNSSLVHACWVLTDRYLPFPYSWSLLLFQQPVGRQDLHHHVWSHQHVLLSCHGMSCVEPHVRLKGLQRAVDLFAFGVCRISTMSPEDGTFTAVNCKQ